MKYLISIDEILDFNHEKLNNWFSEVKGIKISNLKVKDLVFYNDEPILTGNGVYIFKEKNNAIYVGNCVARNFVERIPAHFDIRHNGWFNSLLVNLIKRKYNSDKNRKEYKTDENLIEAAEFAFNNLELVLINFPEYNKLAINRLEVFFKIVLNPINGFKHKTLQNVDINIRDYIQYKL